MFHPFMHCLDNVKFCFAKDLIVAKDSVASGYPHHVQRVLRTIQDLSIFVIRLPFSVRLGLANWVILFSLLSTTVAYGGTPNGPGVKYWEYISL